MFGFKKKKKFFDSEISPKCEICLYCYDYTTKAVCKYKNTEKEVDLEGSCKKYKYDPTKRLPKKEISIPKYNPDDFKL